MTSSELCNLPPIPKDLDDLVESIFTKQRNLTLTKDSAPPEWQRWWDYVKNDGEAVSFVLQSGINSIMNGSYSIVMKRVYDTASKKKHASTQNDLVNSAKVDRSCAGSSGHRFDRKPSQGNIRYHSERARYQDGSNTVRPFQSSGSHWSSEYVGHERRDLASKGRNRSMDLANDIYGSIEDFNRSKAAHYRAGAVHYDNDDSEPPFRREQEFKRDFRHISESRSAYNRRIEASSRSADDRSYRSDFDVSREQRQGGFDRENGSDVNRYEHHARSKIHEKERLMNIHSSEKRKVDRPHHSSSSLTSSEYKNCISDNGRVHPSSWISSRNNKLRLREHTSCNDGHSDGMNDDESHNKHHRSNRLRALEVDKRTMNHNAAIPSLAIVKGDCIEQKSRSINGKHEGNNTSSPRSRKTRKSKRRRRSSNYDSDSSISGSSTSSRSSSRRRNYNHSGSSHRRKHNYHGESDEGSCSSSTYRHSRRKRKSARQRHKKLVSDGISDNRKKNRDRDFESEKDARKGKSSRKKRNPQDHDKQEKVQKTEEDIPAVGTAQDSVPDRFY